MVSSSPLDNECEPRPGAGCCDRGHSVPCATSSVSCPTAPTSLGFGDWAEQLIAESTGKLGKGILPVVLDVDSLSSVQNLPDLQVVRLVG